VKLSHPGRQFDYQLRLIAAKRGTHSPWYGNVRKFVFMQACI